MVEKLLLTNLVQGAVCLLWLAGLRRFAGPLRPGLWRGLLALAIALPVLLLGARAAGLPAPPDALHLLRISRWADLLTGLGPTTTALLAGLLAGTVAVFLVQEAWPALRSRRRHLGHRVPAGERLRASLERVWAAWLARGMAPRRGRKPVALELDSQRPAAALVGIVFPTVVVSRGLLATVDDAELDAVVAHEVAHLATGGNRESLVLWTLRALQAFNPFALLLFRALLEAREAHCDWLAATVTGRPGALAAALLRSRRKRSTAWATRWLRARAELDRRAETASTRGRVRALLSHRRGERVHPLIFIVFAAILGGVLWTIT